MIEILPVKDSDRLCGNYPDAVRTADVVALEATERGELLGAVTLTMEGSTAVILTLGCGDDGIADGLVRAGASMAYSKGCMRMVCSDAGLAKRLISFGFTETEEGACAELPLLFQKKCH